MANKNTVRRDYIIIKRLQKGDFPTKQELLDCLAACGMLAADHTAPLAE